MLFTPDPIAFTIFGLDIRWYAVLICISMITGTAIGYKRAPLYGIKSDDLLDMVLVSIPAAIVGLRVWYVAFNLENYHSFYDVINLRAGGLAIHGGLIFGMVAAFIMCRIKKISPFEVFDLAFPCIALGQAIGRWGNFFNQEAYGTTTDLPWAISIDGVKVHPTFLYESVWCLLLFIGLSIFAKHRKFSGQIFCLYLIFYSLERFFVEQLRTDSLLAGPSKLTDALLFSGLDPSNVPGVIHIGQFLIYPFRTAQLISLAAIIAALIIYKVRTPNKK